MDQSQESLFNDADLQLIESMSRDDNAKPIYDEMKCVLIWPDEMPPRGLSPQGFDTLSTLWMARACVHHNRDFLMLPGYTEFLTRAWERAVAADIKWPGMHASRLQLSATDKKLFQGKMHDAMQSATQAGEQSDVL